jgi:hypothetical protein
MTERARHAVLSQGMVYVCDNANISCTSMPPTIHCLLAIHCLLPFNHQETGMPARSPLHRAALPTCHDRRLQTTGAARVTA